MKQIIFALLFFITNLTSFTQNLNLYQLSNYSGIYGLGYNPAAIADTRYSFHLNLGAVAGAFGRNMLQNTYLPFSKKTYTFGKNDFKTERIEITGPSLMIQLPKGNSFAISTKYRAGQYSNFGDIGNIFENSSQFFSNSDDRYNARALREYAFTYAHPFAFNNHFIKAGATYKLAALASYTRIAFGSGDFIPNPNSTNLSKEFSGNINAVSTDLNTELKVANLFKNKSNGAGFDLGFVYEFRPKHDDFAYQMDGKKRYDSMNSKYLFKFAFSIMDIGGISQDKYNAVSYFSKLENYKIDETSVGGTILQDLSKMKLQANSATDVGETVYLPQRINIFLDSKLGSKGWYVGLFANSKVKNTDLPNDEVQKNALAPSQIFALIPRYEKEGFDFSMPVVYQKETKKIGLGLQLNFGSLFVGTESLNSFFQKNAPNPTVYAGFSINKLAKRIKDSDGDGVSDKEDKCPDIKGLWSFRGCPDTDGDGIKDAEDDCPEHAGPRDTKGCPDTDKDGIFDKNDACPTAAGPSKFNGCPDTDNDGLPDNEDECPTKAGSAAFGGCPDTDKDGLMDNEDECPEQAGQKILKGCPDSDGDGIADKNDACPTAKGSLANNGCPDSDNDGVVDKNDNCPNEAGKKELNGCPDSDNDGIKNSDDKCPEKPGTKENSGCPDSDNDGLADHLDKCINEKGLKILDGCAIKNLTMEFDLLKSLTDQVIQNSISQEIINQVEGLATSKNNSPLVFVLQGEKAILLKPIIEGNIANKFGLLKYEFNIENTGNINSLKIQFKN